MKKVELLAPAGDKDRLIAAVNAGCDAVYLGLKNYSARAFAGNFSCDEIKDAVSYCHIRNVKVYVTINTMLLENEINNAIDDVDYLYKNDVDALLIQDFGLFDYVRKCYPDFEIHCSTQMHVHNLAGVKFMKEEGAKRVVLARETPIEIIKEACKLGIEIETFVYGAICISYSGQCLMSSSLKNRSANRGICAQCCRLKYFKEDGSSFSEGNFILSPKDLNLLDKIPELIEAGISSLKIEGRMKRPEYVYLITKTFRELIDAYYEGKPCIISSETQKQLLLMFNRGFSHGHIFHDNENQRMSHYRPNHMGIKIGEVVSYKNNEVIVKLTDNLYQHDGLRIIHEPIDIGLTAVKIKKNGILVNSASSGDIVTLSCKNELNPIKGEMLVKTSDVKLITKINEEIKKEKKIDISIEYKAILNKPFEIIIRDDLNHEIKEFSSLICQSAKNAPLNKERIEKNLLKTGDVPFLVKNIKGEVDNIFLPISEINETRRIALNKLMVARSTYHDHSNIKEYYAGVNNISKSNNELIVYDSSKNNLVESPIKEKATNKEFYENKILSSISDLYGEHINCLIGFNLNVANSYACAYFMEKEGINGILFSTELNNDQIKDILDAFENRYQAHFNSYRLVYGKRTIMYIKDRFQNDLSLKSMIDFHKKQYEIRYNDGITSILEPEPLQSSNPYCDGSVIIIRNEENEKEIIKKVYEEVY